MRHDGAEAGRVNQHWHFPSFSGGLSLRLSPAAGLPAGCGDFPSFSGGLSLRLCSAACDAEVAGFPFLFGRAFIEAGTSAAHGRPKTDFPSFSGGLSLRQQPVAFPAGSQILFPFLFGRAFIEARNRHTRHDDYGDFPSFSGGLSLRP